MAIDNEETRRYWQELGVIRPGDMSVGELVHQRRKASNLPDPRPPEPVDHLYPPSWFGGRPTAPTGIHACLYCQGTVIVQYADNTRYDLEDGKPHNCREPKAPAAQARKPPRKPEPKRDIPTF